jgi:Flp pilus assembly protein TadG
MHRLASLRRRARATPSRGQSLVELALVLPVILLVLLFAIDFGRGFYSWVILQNASRIGANYAALNPEGWEGTGSPTIKAEYAALVSKDWGTLGCPAPADPVFTDSPADTSTAGQTPDTAYDVGDTASVTLTCPFRPLTPVISAIVGNTLQLTANSEFRIRSGEVAGLDNDAAIPKPSIVAPTPTPGPTATPGPTGTPGPTATPGPTPAPTPACVVVPDLTLEAGNPETVAQARAEWAAAGFTGAFSPNGSNTKIVTGQAPLAGGPCVPATTTMTVTHT